MALKVRNETLGAETGVKSELLAPTSAMLSGITGVWPQPNKAIVGRNAFAHEAGIHQHGVLKNPLTYEIMTPASVGVRETAFVLGKHSGKHAVESRLRALGLVLGEGRDRRRHRQGQGAGRPEEVRLRRRSPDPRVEGAPEHRARLVRYQAVTGNDVIPTATVEIEIDGRAPLGLRRRQRSSRRRHEGRRGRPRLRPGADRAAHAGRAPPAPTRWPRSSSACATARPSARDRPRAPTRWRPRCAPTSRRWEPCGRRRRRWREPTGVRHPEDALREGVGRPRRPAGQRRHARRPLRRPAPHPRGDVSPGLPPPARAGAQGPPPRPDGGDDGPLDAHHAARATAASPSPTRRPRPRSRPSRRTAATSASRSMPWGASTRGSSTSSAPSWG